MKKKSYPNIFRDKMQFIFFLSFYFQVNFISNWKWSHILKFEVFNYNKQVKEHSFYCDKIIKPNKKKWQERENSPTFMLLLQTMNIKKKKQIINKILKNYNIRIEIKYTKIIITDCKDQIYRLKILTAIALQVAHLSSMQYMEDAKMRKITKKTDFKIAVIISYAFSSELHLIWSLLTSVMLIKCFRLWIKMENT